MGGPRPGHPVGSGARNRAPPASRNLHRTPDRQRPAWPVTKTRRRPAASVPGTGRRFSTPAGDRLLPPYPRVSSAWTLIGCFDPGIQRHPARHTTPPRKVTRSVTGAAGRRAALPPPGRKIRRPATTAQGLRPECRRAGPPPPLQAAGKARPLRRQSATDAIHDPPARRARSPVKSQAA